jgi:hypothetical protein
VTYKHELLGVIAGYAKDIFIFDFDSNAAYDCGALISNYSPKSTNTVTILRHLNK